MDNDDLIDGFLNDLPRIPLLQDPHRIVPVNDEEGEVDGLVDGLMADLAQMTLLPHHIIPINDEEDEDPLLQNEEIDDMLNRARYPPLPDYGPNQILQVDLNFFMLPNHWPMYEGMNYFGLDEEIQAEMDEDEDMEEDEDMGEDEDIDEDEGMAEGAEMEEEEDVEEEEDPPSEGSIKRPISTTSEGSTKRPISTIKLEDMITGGKHYIATIDLQEVNTTHVFVPTLESQFSHQ